MEYWYGILPMYTNRPLYGGAITCDIKSDWKDVSDIRQVPDHQECFQELEAVFQELEGAVLVVEIRQRQEVSDEDAAAYFFKDLAESNGSTENHFEPKMLFRGNPMTRAIRAGIGVQIVVMGREVRFVQVELCVFRLANVGTDLLVTISKPIKNVSSMDPYFSEPFAQAVTSLQVKDWGLFGQSHEGKSIQTSLHHRASRQGDASDGFGSVSTKPLPGEEVLMKPLAEAAAQAVEKGLAKKVWSKVAAKVPKPAPVQMTSLESSGAVDMPVKESVPETGPRKAGARRSTPRRRKTDSSNN